MKIKRWKWPKNHFDTNHVILDQRPKKKLWSIVELVLQRSGRFFLHSINFFLYLINYCI